MRILIISYHYPPGKNSQAQHVYNLSNILGINNTVEVLTAQQNESFLESVFSTNVTIYRTNLGLLHRNKSKNSLNSKTKFDKKKRIQKNKIVSRLKKILWPDSVIDWYPIAYKWLKTKEDMFDVIISVATPYTDFFIGNSFIKSCEKKGQNLRHILIYADPWQGEESVKKSKLRKIFEFKIEQKLLEKADWVFMVTQNALKDYVQRYPCIKEKSDYYYLGHDVDENIINNVKNKSAIFRMRYFGSIQSVHRDPFIFFDVLDSEEYVGKIEFDLFLLPHSSHKQILDRVNSSKNLNEIIKFFPSVSYEEMLKISSQNGINVVFGNKSKTQIPGKVFDYIGVKSTILYVKSAFNEEIEDILKRYNAAVICENDFDKIKKVLDSIVYNSVEKEKMLVNKEVYDLLKVENSYKIVQNKIRDFQQERRVK